MIGLGLSVYKSQGISIGGGGSGPSSGYTPPLDAYPATAAYSVRKLSSTYSGSAIEAYRVSDGATQDIGFDGDGLLNTADIISFASGGEVRVRTWYDQSGNTLDAVQTTPSQMPQIYDGSAVITQGEHPAILWDGTNQTYLQTGLYDAWSDGSSFTTMVFNGRRGPAGSHTYWDIESGVQRYSSGVGNMFALFYGTSQVSVPTNIAPTTQGIHTWYSVASEADASVYIDGALKGANTRTNPVGDTNVSAYIGSRMGGSQWNSSHYQEIIHYGSDVVSIRTGLESNLNSYYQIANLPATTGFLADYPDAAAAYSVRQLSNNAIKCMRVRRTVAPFDEQDIGFTAGGDLDEAAIVAFGGSDVLTVSAWYDQSGQSRHASQGTAASQPQIYDGSAVITENGKPAIKPTSGTQYLSFGIPTSASGVTGFTVLRQTASFACVINGTTVSNYLGIGQDGSTSTIINQNTGNVSMRKDAATWTPSTRDDFRDGLATGNHLFSFYTDITTDFTDAFGYVGAPTISMMQMQEAILYPINEFTSGNLSGIETNIMTYYNIP